MNQLAAFFLAFVISGMLTLPVPAVAAKDGSTSIVLQKEQTVNKDYFAAGDTVTLSGTVNGDAYVAGGNIIVEGVVNGDLLAGGGTVMIRGKVRDDVRVAGGQIIVSGDVGRNITAVGGSVTIADSAKISGSLTAGTGNLSIFAPIGKEANIGAGQLTLANTVNGDMQAGVGQLSLTPSGKVLGDLTYWSDTTIQPAPGQITGKITHYLPPKPREDARKDVEKPAALLGIFSIVTTLSFLAALVTGLLMTYFMPLYTQKTATMILKKPFLSLGVGFLTIVLAPIVFVLLLVTVIGIPLGLILLAGFLLFSYLAKIFVGVALGQKALTLFGKKATLGFALVLGLILYYVLSVIPVIGFLFWMVAGLIGLGAILLERKDTYSDLRKKKLI